MASQQAPPSLAGGLRAAAVAEPPTGAGQAGGTGEGGAPAFASGAGAPGQPESVASAPVPEEPSPPISGPLLGEAEPTALEVPSIGLRTDGLVPLGLMSDGSMEVPADYDRAGWYRHGPTPGELGPAVLAGHVDSAAEGPAVFFRLAELSPGAEVLVTRADGQTAVFAVERVEQYPKDEFPTQRVYGDIDHAGLRLITCGGAFDPATGHYRDNIVVYARLADVR
ncbi:class F sortase [Geodermatophilus sp. DF01-2]|uniref:class F sortase n=1 Tax=Geodermatophilus sp. DF01-2 TaxID=2559610 RepID=UPI001073DC24|nr:class F sortase [Geodermatophilus sp. DF01_2]TFV60168.1 class F sortase [Geodermatophilus sp. DF01_2]